MIVLSETEEIKIESDVKPIPTVRTPFYLFDEKKNKDIKSKPYYNTSNVNFFINYDGEEYTIFINKGYTWDGASIPIGFRWLIGPKGCPAFLLASMVHDYICECKWLVDYDRYLSSLILYQLLLACDVPEWKAKLMRLGVELYQKHNKEWKNVR